MHLVLPPSADLYAQVIYAHLLGSIYAFIQYALYACSLTRLFTQFNALVYSMRVDTNVLNSDYLRTLLLTSYTYVPILNNII